MALAWAVLGALTFFEWFPFAKGALVRDAMNTVQGQPAISPFTGPSTVNKAPSPDRHHDCHNSQSETGCASHTGHPCTALGGFGSRSLLIWVPLLLRPAWLRAVRSAP